MAFAKPTPEGIADEVERLLNAPEARQTMASRALEHVQELSWEKSARLVEAAIKQRVSDAVRGVI
jgi:glycosyltransferase involved in cell wall biosynthesis